MATTVATPPTSTPPTSREPPAQDGLRPPYVAAGIAGAMVFLLYAVTLARTTAFWDTSEYIATAHILGIPHPPGNPLFVVLARAWTVLLAPLGLSVAVRVNLFSAAMSAGAHALWFLVIHHILRYFSPSRIFRLAGAAAAVLVSATAFTVWNQSNVNEKVYTVSLLTIALLSWLAVRWQENLGRGKDDNLLVLMAFILALSVGNHLMAFLAAPAIGLFIVVVHPRTLLNWRLYVAAAAAALVGLSIHLFLPLRAALHPVINEANPTCAGLGSALESIVTYGKAGCVALSEALTRQQYLKPPLLPRQAAFSSQLVNYLQYFDWQWARGLDGNNVVFAHLRLPFTMLFTGLGAWGAVEHFRKDRTSFAYMATLFATLSLALVVYLNFKYGYSLQAPAGAAHEVRERDYFFVAGFSVWGLWAGMGIAALWRELAHELKTGFAKASPVLALALLPLFLNWGWASRAKDYTARDWAYNLLMSVEPYSVLFTNGDNDTFPLWYLQEVEGIRRDVTVIVTSYLNTDWYTEQLRDLTRPCPESVDPSTDWTRIICQRPYTAENTAAMYTDDPAAARAAGKVPLVLDRPIHRPARAILSIDDATITRVAGSYARVEQDRNLRLGNVIATIRGGQILYPWQQFALSLINESLGDRPVYFASSGNAAQSLGVAPYLIRQGLAFKLHNGPLPDTALAGVERLDDSPYSTVTGTSIDVARTRLLADSVFVHHSGVPDGWDHWPDRATIGIPNYYGWVYLALMEAAAQDGDTDAVARYRERSQAWNRLGM